MSHRPRQRRRAPHVGPEAFAPDGFFIKKQRVPSPLPKEFPGAPDLVLEVLSPSTRDDDLNDKRGAYRAARVTEIWLVDAEEKRIVVDRLRGAGYEAETVARGRVASTALEGFWIEAEWLWSAPLPNPISCLDKILSSG